MRPLFYITILLLLLVSCRENIDLELRLSDPQLVIDAGVIYRKQGSIENPLIFQEFYANLSLTGSYYENPSKLKKVSSAKVYINQINGSARLKRELKRSKITEGYYVLFSTFSEPINYNIKYNLEVEYNEQRYVSSLEKPIPTPKIKKIIIGKIKNPFLDDSSNTLYTLYFDDDKSSKNYYMAQVTDRFFLRDDRLYDGKSQYVLKVIIFHNSDNKQFFYNDFDLMSINSSYYKYLEIVRNTVSRGNNGSRILAKGNIYNTTEERNFPLGYFRVVEMKHYKIK